MITYITDDLEKRKSVHFYANLWFLSRKFCQGKQGIGADMSLLRTFHENNLKLYLEKEGKKQENVLQENSVRDEITKTYSKEVDVYVAQELKHMTDADKEKHYYSAIVTMAMDTAFSKAGMSDSDCEKHILGNWKFMMVPLYRGIKGRLKRAAETLDGKSPIEEFADYATSGTMDVYKDFGPDMIGMKSGDSYGFNLHRCLFYECFQRHGKAERVGSVMCNFDKIMAEVISPWLEFNHNSTIARGGSCCQFRYCAKGVDPSKLDW